MEREPNRQTRPNTEEQHPAVALTPAYGPRVMETHRVTVRTFTTT